MKRFKQIALITLWSAMAVGLLISMGFVNKEQDALRCKNLNIRVNQDDDLCFLDKMDIAQLIKKRGDSIVGQPKSSVNIVKIERALSSHANIADAQVNVTIDGQVNVAIRQRKPIIRIINANGDSYYVDDDGKLMPLSDKYTAKVLIANGNIMEPYAKRYMYSANQIYKNEVARKNSMIDELYAMGMYININPFWKAQVQQLYINDDKDLELVPMAGDQRIIFGDTTCMEEKFKKLLTFYQQGLNTTGWWDKYATINLKFKNQIVCTKKENTSIKLIN